MNKKNTPQDKILSDYEEKGNEIIRQMVNILARAHQKIDNKAYREMLGKLEHK